MKNIIKESQFFRAGNLMRLVDTLRHNNGARTFSRWARASEEASHNY